MDNMQGAPRPARRRTWHAAFLGISLGLSLQVAPASAADATVKIDNFTFTPPQLAVAPGTTVTWINGDDIPHTVTAADGKAFRSKALDTNDRYTFTFKQAGEYAYFCSLHPFMKGTIVVKAP